ncbi:unnamed protein product [Phytophthora fragariaefolia]|uniref:Unnamed protein product n=1 Tax=Phytophthora fragariaefolia TaxID=1490495 RepID=A0A9W6YCA8_9STRA|nr:unnamed protein product [Phytophthora fragariaefolia]
MVPVAVKTELSAPLVLELLVPHFTDVGDVQGSVPVALDLSPSLNVQLVFWERFGVTKDLECINEEEGCPRCKFESFLRGLVILKRRGVLHINGANAVLNDFARLRLQIEGFDAIGAEANLLEFSFVSCHLKQSNSGRTGETDIDKVAAAKHSTCHVVGCNLHRWKAVRVEETSDTVRRSQERSNNSVIENRAQLEPLPNRKLNLPDVFHSLMAQIEVTSIDLWSERIPGLNLKLYEHQRRGLGWMMKREKAVLWETALPQVFTVPGRPSHDSDNILLSAFPETAYDSCGGMLCDEPGLGKTITMLALILLTKGQSTATMPARADEPVPHTFQLRASSRGRSLQTDYLLSTSACLVVAPDALVEHWAEQIKSHVVEQGFKTYVDRADKLAKPLPESDKLVQFDVVIVSFSRMTKEWRFHRPPSATEARVINRYGFEDQPDRYWDGSLRGSVSTLLKIHWLRVVVDEGHKLGGRAPTQLMQMARLLCAERRWVMTGTPSPNTLKSADLLYIHGLLVFLRNQPYGRADGRAWTKAIAGPFERDEPVGFYRLQHLLSRIMIRHTKDSIRDKLPEPIRHTVVVDPSPSEFKLYNALAEHVRANLVSTSIDLPSTVGSSPRSHLKSLLNRENRRKAGQIESGLTFAFIGGYAVEWTVKTERMLTTLKQLRSSGVCEPRVLAMAEYLNGIHLKKKTRCADCGEGRRFLMVFPCGHLCCAHCIDELKTEIGEYRCNFCYEPYDEDEFNYLQPTLTGEWTARGREQTLGKLRASGVNEARVARVAAYIDTLEANPATECRNCQRQLHLLLVLPCGHLSCPDCVEKRYQEFGPSCVLCHAPCARNGFIALQPEILPKALEDDSKPARRNKVKTGTTKKQKRKQKQAGSAQKRAVNYKRDYWKIDSSKIFYTATRVRELIKEFAREQCPKLKVIIFSQFRESIWRTKVAFEQQDIPTADFIALLNPRERSKNLEEFRSNENVHVLLLSNLGSHGLDLSFVTHIFLLEEIWDKSVEMQVISRAHRMGASRSVVVEQLWMRGTVECQLTATNQQLFKNETAIDRDQGVHNGPTREEVQEASSADKSSFQQMKMNYILNNLRVLSPNVVGKDGEVRFCVRNESEAIIRQGIHTISDSGEINTVLDMPNPPQRSQVSTAYTRFQGASQRPRSPAETTPSQRKRSGPPEVIVIDDSIDSSEGGDNDSDSEEIREESAPVIPVQKPQQNEALVKQEPAYIEIMNEETESE